MSRGPDHRRSTLPATDDPAPPIRLILRAAWVAPIHRPPLPDGAVAVAAGRILAVGSFDQLRAQLPGARVEELGEHVLLPGLVNAHIHLELSDCIAGEPPADGFAAWLLRIVRRNAAGDLAERVARAIQIGIKQCLRYGVTSVGDITRQPALTRPLLAGAPLRVTSYGEVQAMARRRPLLDERLAAATDASHASPRLRVGLTPHAPYTVEPAAYARCLSIAMRNRLPLATHLAESPDEAAFLARHAGPFRTLWETLGSWDDAVPTFDGGPIRLAKALGLLDHPTLLAHVNYCDDEELELLAAGRASVAYCPRTHAYFGHPPHRWRDMLAAGVNVALATDSCASSPDLNLLDDLRLVHRQAPAVPSDQLWPLVTTCAARAIGAADVGSLAPGNWADMVAFPARGRDGLRSILEETMIPSRVWVAGQAVRG